MFYLEVTQENYRKCHYHWEEGERSQEKTCIETWAMGQSRKDAK